MSTDLRPAGADIKAAARRVLEEVFPADDDVALALLVSDQVANHEAPPGTPPPAPILTRRRR